MSLIAMPNARLSGRPASPSQTVQVKVPWQSRNGHGLYDATAQLTAAGVKLAGVMTTGLAALPRCLIPSSLEVSDPGQHVPLHDEVPVTHPLPEAGVAQLQRLQDRLGVEACEVVVGHEARMTSTEAVSECQAMKVESPARH